MNARSLLVPGMLVGVAAGLLAFGFGWLFGERRAVGRVPGHGPPTS